MKRHIKVYIIIINFGEPNHTIECLQSIIDNNYSSFQVILVDISDINQSIEKLNGWIEKKNDPRFTIIQEKQNKGFAFANNIGIKHSLKQDNCKFLWILNNDTVIEKDSLAHLINYYTEKANTKNIGIVGSKIMDYKERDHIQSVGGRFNSWTKFPDWIGMGEKDIGQFDNNELKVDHVLGASMFLQKSLIQQIGLMPEDYFLYFEDTDWCIKAQRVGFQNSVCTKSIVYHKQGASTGVKYLNDEKHLQNKKYFYVNLLKFYGKNFKLYLPMAYFILFKKMLGKVYHRNYKEARLISRVIFNSKIKSNN